MKKISILFLLLMTAVQMKAQTKNIYLGGGCFWCIETIFDELKGVEKAESGYAGGDEENPTYKQISSHETNHAEVVKVTYNPKVITLEQLLEVFFYMHNPTTLNRQGNDVGTQYRSIVLYEDKSDKGVIEQFKSKSEASKLWDGVYTTEIVPLKKYYTAEDYHQNYYQNNKTQPYCSYTIAPKIEKFHKHFKDWLK